MKIEVPDGRGPGAWLKERHPAQFSDSVPTTHSPLGRTTLEFQLESLGNRSQEADFERFARALVSAELCPNLLPQTGPTGGGDSKVDAETYPVSSDLTLNWIVGEPERSSKERWAFAFSTMKDWAAKVRTDVAKIAAVQRGYTKAFFVSSRFISDQRRSKVEDELTKTYGVEVRVLDRTWIVERVYAGHHEAMASDTLRISVPGLVSTRVGPLDQNREEALAATQREIAVLQQKLSDPYSGSRLVAALLEAATLSRALQHPADKVEGRFNAACRAAKKFGSPQQVIEATYEWVRTTFWWLEDADAFEQAFDEFETLTGDLDDIYALDLRSNLLLCRSAAGLHDGNASAKNGSLREELARKLDDWGTRADSPNGSALARYDAATLRFFGASKERAAELFGELRAIADDGHSLIGFPLGTLVKVVSEYGKAYGDLPQYDPLLEHVTSLLARQEGDVQAAKALVFRGRDHIVAERNYQAIAAIGKALTRLVSHRGRDTLAHALFLLGNAYENVGLLWAARGAFIHAAAVALEDFYDNNEASENQVTCMRRVRDVEARLGRIGHALAWRASARHFMGLVDGQTRSEDRVEDEAEFSLCLTILLLRTPFSELQHIAGVPDQLVRIRLPLPDVAARFALGHQADAQEKLEKMGSTRLASELFTDALSHEIASEIASEPVWHDGVDRRFKSVVLGCEVCVATHGTELAHEVGENVVAMLEALLATGMIGERPIVALSTNVTVFVTEVDECELPLRRMVDAGTPSLGTSIVLYARVLRRPAGGMSPQQQGDLQQETMEVVAKVALTAYSLGNEPEELIARFDQERAHERTLGLTSTRTCLHRAIGDMPVTIDGWSSESVCFIPLREKQWTPETEAASEPSKSQDESPQPTFADLRHDEIRSVSLIHREQWRAAGWWGFAFAGDPEHKVPPLLCPCFTDLDKGRKVFSDLQKAVQDAAGEQNLKVAIVRGISANDPFEYRITIGSMPRYPLSGSSSAKMLTTVALGKDFTPTNHALLNSFLTGYAKHKLVRLVPMIGTSESIAQDPAYQFDLAISLDEVEVVDAWRINGNSFSVCALQPDDEPFIPDGHKNDAPVLQILQQMKPIRRN